MSFAKNIINSLLRKLCEVEENKSRDLDFVYNILVIRQHNQLGDLIISTPIFRALKEKYPHSNITVIVSPANYKALIKNPFIDTLFIFDKQKLFQIGYHKKLRKILKSNYDAAIVPAVTSISFTSNFLARLANSKIRIGPNSLNGKTNPSSFLFDRRIDLDWRDKPDTHVSQRNMDIIAPFGISTDDLSPVIHSDEEDNKIAEEFIRNIPGDKDSPLIGIHIGAGKVQNRWSHIKFAQLIDNLSENLAPRFYLSMGSKDDNELIEFVKSNTKKDFSIFDKPGMPILKSLIEISDLFITNDTGPMHTAAATKTPTISLFGPTDPKMWAPNGDGKHFLRNGEDINSINVDDVYNLAMQLIKK